MYFSPEQADEVIKRFHHSLRENGLLILSPAETSIRMTSLFDILNIGDMFIFRKYGGNPFS